MSTDVNKQIQQMTSLGEQVCNAMCKEVFKSGLSVSSSDLSFQRAQFKLSQDPFDGGYSLIGVWKDSRGHRQGEILFHSDGSFYAEYDVVSEHPAKPQWFIEAVTAWGNPQQLNSELRLLPSIS